MRAVLLALAATLLLQPWSAVHAADTDGRFYVGGIQVHELDHARWVGALRHAGMNTVAVTVYAKQGPWNTDKLWFEDEEPAVLDEIRAARGAGLSVVLILRVALDHAYPENEFLWHGMIMPGSEEAVDGWFATYTRFVVKWARIAEAEGVEILGIGSEMNELNETLPLSRIRNLRNYYGYHWYERLSRKRARRFAERIEASHLWVRGRENYDSLEEFLDARFERTTDWARQAHLRRGAHTLRRVNDRRRRINAAWIRLIEATRAVYDGKLTYAANFDSYHDVGFWSHLDMIGINAYFSLRPNLMRSEDAAERLAGFVDSWKLIVGRIEAVKRSRGLESMPFLFTELGYTFRRHSTVEPWAHGGFSVVGWKGEKRQFVVWSEQPIDHEERQLAVEGLAAAHESLDSDLRGLLYWKLSTDKAHEAIEPFVLHIGAGSTDRLQEILAGFASGP